MAKQRAVNGGGRGRGRRKGNAADADASVSSAFLNSHATNRTRIVPGVIGFVRLVTNCVTLDRLPSSLPHSLPLPLAAFPLLSMPTKLELIIIIIIGISVKCDLNLIILNYFVTCISFSFSISFSFPFFFSVFCTRNAQLQFLSEFLIPYHASSPLALWLFLFGFGFGLISILSFSACVFFCFLLVHSSGFSADWAALSPRDGCICLIEIDFSFLAGDLRLDLRTIITITILYGIALYCAVF